MEYKRKTRSVSPTTKQKISSTLKSYNATHPRTDAHKQRISNGLKDYWKQIPSGDETLTDELENGEIV